MKNKIPLKKFSINLSEKQIEIIHQIQEHVGASNLTTAIQFALGFWKQKTQPHYLSQGAIKIGKTPEERAQDSLAIRNAKETQIKEAKFASKKNICENVLGGEVFQDSSGGFSCRFSTHFAEGLDEQQILPLDNVNVGYSKYQFFPDRKTVFEKRPELKKKFPQEG